MASLEFPAWLFPAELQLPLSEEETTSKTELVGDAIPVHLRPYAQLAQLLFGVDVLFKSNAANTVWWNDELFPKLLLNIDRKSESRVSIPKRWFHIEDGQSDDALLASWNGGLPYFACFLARYDTIDYAASMLALLAFDSPLMSEFANKSTAEEREETMNLIPTHPRSLYVNGQIMNILLRETLAELLSNYLNAEDPLVIASKELQRNNQRNRDRLQVNFSHMEVEFKQAFHRLAGFFLSERGIPVSELEVYTTPALVLHAPASTYNIPARTPVTAPEGSQRPLAGVFAALACTGRGVYAFFNQFPTAARATAVNLHLDIQDAARQIEKNTMKRPALLYRVVQVPPGDYLDMLLSIRLEELTSSTAHVYVSYRLDAMVTAVATVIAFDNFIRQNVRFGGRNASNTKDILRDCLARLSNLCTFLRENMLTENDADYAHLNSQELADLTYELEATGADIFNSIWKCLDTFLGVVPASYKNREYTTDFFIWLRSQKSVELLTGFLDSWIVKKILASQVKYKPIIS